MRRRVANISPLAAMILGVKAPVTDKVMLVPEAPGPGDIIITGGAPVLDTIWVLRCITCQRDFILEDTHPNEIDGSTIEHGPRDRAVISKHVGHNMMALEMGRPGKP